MVPAAPGWDGRRGRCGLIRAGSAPGMPGLGGISQHPRVPCAFPSPRAGIISEKGRLITTVDSGGSAAARAGVDARPRAGTASPAPPPAPAGSPRSGPGVNTNASRRSSQTRLSSSRRRPLPCGHGYRQNRNVRRQSENGKKICNEPMRDPRNPRAPRRLQRDG